ncbi:hypothetical protein [Stigmatella aurantiaca]|uniref:Uncharacterized protein n=1 Tax=Stigmatella aurantiaca (strain DW4/3-1) TaxID=378806 RepID=Q09E50_STIAD|nr:hypothetical protein [Stigmatella aurantiaca]ADO74741.1 uncharacterized protein STAUR_6985 [Stigmatella aurantiaca DW4/3-1]EAU69974.1 hypothetical protein STIAU_8397 [Stigmatella aurantiaca DW4/3-1]
MKTVTVSLLFALSLFTLFSSARANALGRASMEPRMARPQPLMEGDGKGDDKDDEGDEEDYRQLNPRAALEWVDPGAQAYMLRLRAAALQGR